MLGMELGINGKALINIPDNVLKHGFVLPNFQGLFYDRTLWSVMAVAIVTLTMVDGVESLATAQAVDKIDPFHRKSSPNRVLMAMGVLNIASSLGGGLTIIPGGVKSKACIVGGGRTLWANFYNACFLLCFLFIARPVINLIPYAALAAILIYTGYKMCEPKIWRHIKGIGWEQLALFTITVVATLLSDLLIGIIVGVASKLLLNLAFMVRGMPFSQIIPRVPGLAMGLFRSPVRSTISVDADTVKLVFDGPLVCFNTLQVNRALGLIPKNTHHLYLEFKEHVSMIDHTSCENLVNFGEEFENSGRGDVHFEGMDLLTRLSPHETCTRIRRINLNAPLPKPALVPFDGFQIDPISPIAVSEALQDSALETALVRESERENEWPVHAGHPNAAMIRLGMVPVGRFLKNPDGELSTFGLLEAAPARKAFKEEPIYPFI
jgi:MFS superfamily sulfate permease-like transporter